jgi:hypothetical protein
MSWTNEGTPASTIALPIQKPGAPDRMIGAWGCTSSACVLR